MNNSILSIIDHFTHKLGLVNSLVEKLVERIVPQQTASACGGVLCYAPCSNSTCDSYGATLRTHYYAQNAGSCYYEQYICSFTTCDCFP